MKQLITAFTAALVIGAAIMAPAPAYAWATGQSADSGCVGAQSIVSWTFSNTEPNLAKWSMDIVVKDSITGKVQGPFTVKAGESKTGAFATDGPVLSGTISYELTWTDGRSGVDSRASAYDATTCNAEEPKTVEVCRDGKIVTIKENERLSTDTNAPCVVLGEEKPKELPNTGIESVIGGFAGTSALGFGLREFMASRKQLRRGLLKR